MEDTSTTTRTSVTHRVSPAYSAKIYKQLVRRLTEDLNHGLANTCNDFNLEDKCAIHFLLEAGNYSYTSARTAAIIARREKKKKQRTKARNEKARADRLAQRDAFRKQKAEKERNEGWDAGPLPEGMFIQFYPGKNDAAQTYRGISVNFPDGFLLYHKRLERGSFEMPRRNADTGYYELPWETFNFIMSGVSLESVSFRKRYRTRFVSV